MLKNKSTEKKILWTKWKFIKIYMNTHRLHLKPGLGEKSLRSITSQETIKRIGKKAPKSKRKTITRIKEEMNEENKTYNRVGQETKSLILWKNSKIYKHLIENEDKKEKR